MTQMRPSGEVEVSCKLGHWLSLQEQTRRLRPNADGNGPIRPESEPSHLGTPAQYFSETLREWIDCAIVQITPAGEIEVSCKRGYLLSVPEQQTKLRAVSGARPEMRQGAPVQYFSESLGSWLSTTISQIASGGEVEVSCRLGYWLSPPQFWKLRAGHGPTHDQGADWQSARRWWPSPAPIPQRRLSLPPVFGSAHVDAQCDLRPRFQVGSTAQFYSLSHHRWFDCMVLRSGPGGEVEVSCKPGYWVSLREQVSRMRSARFTGVQAHAQAPSQESSELQLLNHRWSEAVADAVPAEVKLSSLDALADLRSDHCSRFPWMSLLRLRFDWGLKSVSDERGLQSEITVRVLSADLRPVGSFLNKNAPATNFLCAVKAGTLEEVRGQELRSRRTPAARSGEDLQPSWADSEGKAQASSTFVFKSSSSALVLHATVLQQLGLARRGRVVAVALVEIPPGRHLHRLPMICALDGCERAMGPMVLVLETSVEQVHVKTRCEHCRMDPVRGDCFQCMSCPDYCLCAECYSSRAVHRHHTFRQRPASAGGGDHALSGSEELSTELGRPLGSSAVEGLDGAKQDALILSELRQDDLWVDLTRRKLADGSGQVEPLGLFCAQDEENNAFVIINHIHPGSPVARWNEAQERERPWDTYLVVGDAISEVNGVSGNSLQMLAVMGSAETLRLRIARPTRRATAVLEATGGDAEKAADILLDDASASVLHLNDSQETCTICASLVDAGDALRLRPCGHGWFCRGCLQQWAASQAGDGSCACCCPVPDCRLPIGHRQLRAVLTTTAFAQLMRRSVEQICLHDPTLVACPTPDCPNRAWIDEGQEPILICEVCRIESCVRCAETPYHHGLTCVEWARRRELSGGAAARTKPLIMEALRNALFRQCPGCRLPIERMNACCHMTCSNCRTEFSWICGALYHDCRAHHTCLNKSVFLNQILADELRARGLELTDENGSDLFLMMRCACLLANVRAQVGEDAWAAVRQTSPDLLQNVIRGTRSIPWDQRHEVQRFRQLLPHAFP